jgi:hypothetical protein
MVSYCAARAASSCEMFDSGGLSWLFAAPGRRLMRCAECRSKRNIQMPRFPRDSSAGSNGASARPAPRGSEPMREGGREREGDERGARGGVGVGRRGRAGDARTGCSDGDGGDAVAPGAGGARWGGCGRRADAAVAATVTARTRCGGRCGGAARPRSRPRASQDVAGGAARGNR